MIEYENLKKVNQPLCDDFYDTFRAVLDSGYYILGSRGEAFEKAFASFIGVKYAVGVASGLDALILSLQALDLPPRAEVIVGANTYFACVLSIIKADLIPILVEPSEQDPNIDVRRIEEKITPNTRAIMPVHCYGHPCDMTAIEEIAKKYDLHIIEDCAQAHGAKFAGKKVGAFGTLAAFSFYPTKNLGALGDAGAILTDDENLYRKLRALRNYGSQVKYYNQYQGSNSRLDELQAGFLSVKLPYLDRINDHKRALAQIYNQQLDKAFKRNQPHHQAHSVYHIYNVYHEKRDLLRAYLKERGVGTEIHYPLPVYRQEALANRYVSEEYPITDNMHATTLSLPISYFHTPEQIQQVCEIMNQFLKEA